jgi:hypothetical protein
MAASGAIAWAAVLTFVRCTSVVIGSPRRSSAFAAQRDHDPHAQPPHVVTGLNQQGRHGHWPDRRSV